MADKTYDAIVVGGGHQGTIIACYLQHAGMQTVIFERQHELGGGACGEALPLPGFLQNPCAHFTRFYGHPAYEDFKLRGKGLVYVYPDHSEGMIYDDGMSFLGYTAWKVDRCEHRQEPNSAKRMHRRPSTRSLASPNGTRTLPMTSWKNTAKSGEHAFHEWRYNPPTPWGVPDAFERLIDDPEAPIPPEYQFYTSQQVAYDLFESDYLRTLFMRSCMTSSGVFPDDCIGIYKILHTLGLDPLLGACFHSGRRHPCHNPRASEGFQLHGGRVCGGNPVQRAIIENGKAVGVKAC